MDNPWQFSESQSHRSTAETNLPFRTQYNVRRAAVSETLQ